MAKNELTFREKAAIRLYIYTDGDVGIADLYRVAYNGDEAAIARISSIPSVASRWWRSAKVVDYYTREKATYDAKKEKERLQIEREVSARLSSPEKVEIDYSDPKNVLQKLNTIVNSSSDNGEILDAIRLLIQKQNDLAPARKTEQVQRFFTPVQCRDCVVKKAFHKLTTEHPELLKK